MPSRPDNLRSLLEKAHKEVVLVLKDKDRDEVVFNPQPNEVYERLRRKFVRAIRPRGNLKFRYIQQHHVRGSSIHVDFRAEFDEDLVVGFTITVPFGMSKDVMRKWNDAIRKASKEVLGRELENGSTEWDKVSDRDKIKIKRKLSSMLKPSKLNRGVEERWIEDWLNWNRKHPALQKALQDTSWLEAPDTFIPPRFVGATFYEWAYLRKWDYGTLQWGAIKPDHWEMYVESKPRWYTGRIDIIFLPREQVAARVESDEDNKLGRKAWIGLAFTSRNQRPYVISERAVERKWMPPDGLSALPVEIMKLVPKRFRYWEVKNRAKAIRIRDDLVQWLSENDAQFYQRKDFHDFPGSISEVVVKWPS